MGRMCVLGGVWGIIAFEFSVYILVYLRQLSIDNYLLLWWVAPPFVFFSAMTCICYYKAIVTNPGSPNNLVNLKYDNIDQIKQKSKEEGQLKKEIRKLRMQGQPHPEYDQVDSLTKISFCNECQVIKELRVHHCRICNRCIQRMDHHCPWTGGCIGKYNHKFFIQFLFYSSTGLSIIAISVLSDWVVDSTTRNITDTNSYLLFMCAISSGLLAFAIGFLFLSQLGLLSHNLTTLQSFIPGVFYRNPWKKDTCRQNLEQVFGKSSFFIPTKPFPQNSYAPIEL